MNLPTSITNQNELREYLKGMKPGMALSEVNFKVIDKEENWVDLKNTTILCRQRYFIKKYKILYESDYRYEVIASRYLGEGAYGTVFPIAATLKLNDFSKIKVLKKESNKQRVVKVISDGLSAEASVNNEFLNSDIVAYLHIKPPIKVKFPDGNKYYLVMRKIPGQTLLDLLNNGSISKLDTNKKFLLLFSLLEAVKTLHLKNLVHGDINCGNIMVDLESEPLKPSIKIIDFGSSRLESSADEKAAKISNDIPITLETKCRNASQASDIFLLGKIFWFICNKNICDPALDQLLDLRIFLKNSDLQHSNGGATLFDVFQLLVGMLSQIVDEQLNKFHQSIMQAIYIYVQKTYNASGNNKSDSERIINNIQTLLSILRKYSFNEQKSKITF